MLIKTALDERVLAVVNYITAKTLLKRPVQTSGWCGANLPLAFVFVDLAQNRSIVWHRTGHFAVFFITPPQTETGAGSTSCMCSKPTPAQHYRGFDHLLCQERRDKSEKYPREKDKAWGQHSEALGRQKMVRQSYCAFGRVILCVFKLLYDLVVEMVQIPIEALMWF